MQLMLSKGDPKLSFTKGEEVTVMKYLERDWEAWLTRDSGVISQA